MTSGNKTNRSTPTRRTSSGRTQAGASAPKKRSQARSGKSAHASTRTAPSTARKSSSKKRASASNASKRSAARMGVQESKASRERVMAAASGVGQTAAGAVGNGVKAILSNRIATIVVAVIVVLLVVGGVDSIANMGKAYGNVTVAGIDVGGMTTEEIEATLREELVPRVSHSQVKVYASQDAQRIGSGDMTDEERLAQIESIAQAEQISVEQATANVQSWSTDALSLKVSLPYERLAEQAMAVGREDGGVFSRLGLIFIRHDVFSTLDFDEEAVEALASEVDRTVGDARVDATVAIEDGAAHAVEGHDGRMVDRDWFKQQISAAMVSEEEASSFVAEVVDAPSRISFAQASEASDGVNRALEAGAVFTYNGSTWQASGSEIGSWTRVNTVKNDDGSYKLGVSIDTSAAIPAVVKGAGAAVRSENVTVKFAKNDEGTVIVRTFGPGNIPEVTPAIADLDEALYGDGGKMYGGGWVDEPVSIEITESDAPAALTLDQAIELGIVTVIGEYTTEFSNSEGTENRNHNIKLAADILDNGIIEADGGSWHFNDRSGDTNEAAGFWEAGSIIDGEYVDSVGGGICQVATTVFNAVYEAGLPIDMRFPHQLYIESYPSGRDAAVSYPDLDLWWSNNLSSDVLLDLSYTDTTITARLYSVYTGYSVESIQGEWQEGKKYTTKFEEDSDLMKDDYYTKTVGVDGSFISVTRIVRNEAGETISEQTFDSTYDAKEEVIAVGPGTDTKKLAEQLGAEVKKEESASQDEEYDGE